MKTFKGKAIYKPAGKAAEYSAWACNFYKGCSNGCTYCYLKKGVLAHAMGGHKPESKSCFKNEAHALYVFEKELKANLPELQKHGLFFSFTTDPMLPETEFLTMEAADIAIGNDIPVKILTKCVQWVDGFLEMSNNYEDAYTGLQNWRKMFAFGFTLTGHDELEPGASTNAERIEAMKALHEAGFKTFASIEPIVDFDSSLRMIFETVEFCDLYKIGLMSGKKYPAYDLQVFMNRASGYIKALNKKVYFKDSFFKQAELQRLSYSSGIYVERDYNLFNP